MTPSRSITGLCAKSDRWLRPLPEVLQWSMMFIAEQRYGLRAPAERNVVLQIRLTFRS